jgi:thioredoxin reductase (NADPH)
MRELEKEGKVKFHVASVKAMHGEPGQLKGVTLSGADKSEWHHETDTFLPFFGLTIKLGPIAEFGINLHENLIPVDTARFESQTPGIFAIGDINSYTGKLKLILSGFHEAALMAQAAFHVARPNEKLRFQYTTSSSNLQKKLGVS